VDRSEDRSVVRMEGDCRPASRVTVACLKERYWQAWAKVLKHLLNRTAAVERSFRDSRDELRRAVRKTCVARYELLLAVGLAAIPPRACSSLEVFARSHHDQPREAPRLRSLKPGRAASAWSE
jgi:hypothetical protein